MNILSFFRRTIPNTNTAPVARERLQILLAHERAVSGKSDLIAILQDEIMAVIARHFPVDEDSITVKMERGEAVSTLEVEVEIPTPMCPSFPLPEKPAVEAIESEDVKPNDKESPNAEVDELEIRRTGTLS